MPVSCETKKTSLGRPTEARSDNEKIPPLPLRRNAHRGGTFCGTHFAAGVKGRLRNKKISGSRLSLRGRYHTEAGVRVFAPLPQGYEQVLHGRVPSCLRQCPQDSVSGRVVAYLDLNFVAVARVGNRHTSGVPRLPQAGPAWRQVLRSSQGRRRGS